MLKKLTKLGNSQGLVFDAALMELARLKVGDDVNVEVHEGGTITITPMRPRPTPKEISDTIKQTMKDYARTMRRLA
ncbi:MAG: transcriptional regulator/antitoxin, MazE [Opitutae bacterium]|jgi:antitoxin component of MazEF toxin-antitoxin module|nr:transcriptional regulator/antitoxin, MazE [Opitutae bacterium]